VCLCVGEKAREGESMRVCVRTPHTLSQTQCVCVCLNATHCNTLQHTATNHIKDDMYDSVCADSVVGEIGARGVAA